MKILQLCNKAPFPANDGSSIAITNLALGLADNNVELYLLSINTKKHFKPDENVSDNFKTKTHYKSVYKDTNTSVFGALVNLFSNQSYFVSRFYFTEYENALIDLLKVHTFDIIQLEGVFMASYITTIKKYSSAKITLRSHNIEHQIWDRLLSQEKNILKKKYLSIQNKRLKRFELNTFERCDAIVTITNEDKKNIQKLFPHKKIETCLTGISLIEYKKVSVPVKHNTLLHFAAMDWMPNVEAVNWLLEKVWIHVINEFPDAQLVIAGRGMPENIKHLQSKNISVIEHVESSFEFYTTYDIMLVPLWSGSGLRIKLVEGLAYGKAIVTTTIGAEGIPYEKNKHLLIADTDIEFAEAIKTLLRNEVLKINLQNNARDLAEQNFDYKKIASKLIEFYNTLLKS